MAPEATLARVRADDEQAFSDLVAGYVRELHLHCYRILGSVADGIEPWWRSLAGTDFARLYQLRGDVVKVLTHQGLAYRAHPRDKRLRVRPH